MVDRHNLLTNRQIAFHLSDAVHPKLRSGVSISFLIFIKRACKAGVKFNHRILFSYSLPPSWEDMNDKLPEKNGNNSAVARGRAARAGTASPIAEPFSAHLLISLDSIRNPLIL
jgi:hypothetical protein